MTYVVRTDDEPLAIIPSLRAALRAVDQNQPATRIGLMRDALDAATAEPAFYARLLAIFALLAVSLALVGTYGVIAYQWRSAPTRSVCAWPWALAIARCFGW